MLLEQQKLLLENKVAEYLQMNEILESKFEVLKTENESLLSKLNALDEELQQTQLQNEHLNQSYNTLENNFKELENVKQENDIINEKYKNSKLELESFEEKLRDDLNLKISLEEKLNNISVECNDLNNINEKLKKEIENLMSKIQSYEAQDTDYERIKTEFEETSKLNGLLKEKITSLESELAQIESVSKDRENQLEETNNQIVSLRKEKEALKSNVKTLEAKVIGCVQSIKSLPDDPAAKSEVDDITENNLEFENSNHATPPDESTRYTEVISELNDMLQIIRKRGQRISLLEDEVQQKNAEIEEIKTKFEEAENKNWFYQQQTKFIRQSLEIYVNSVADISVRLNFMLKQKLLSSGEKELASKDEELQKMQLSVRNEEDSATLELKEKIIALEEENLQLKKTIEHEGPSKLSVPADAQSEVMSTSTISKMEESHRMKELEDTFEERYMKEKEDSDSVTLEFVTRCGSNHDNVKNGSGLKNLAIKLKKKLLEQTTEIKSLEEAKKKLISEKEELEKKGQGHAITSRNIQALQSEIDKLNDSLDANRKQLKEREKQLVTSAQESADLKSKLVQLEEDNSRLILAIKNTEESFSGQKALSESLQGQVDALEKRLLMEEEKILRGQEGKRELETKVEEEKSVRDQLCKELEDLRQDNKKHSLIDLEMKDYERSIEELTTQVKEKEDIIISLKNKLTMEEEKVTNLSDEISLLKEQVQNESERALKNLRFSKASNDYKEKLSEIRSEQENQIREKEKDRETIETLNQVEVLEESLQKNEKVVENLKEELKELKKQFEAYKIRAQNVLKQKNKVPQQSFEDLKTELTAARAELGYLNSEKEKINEKLSTLSAEYSKKESILESKLESLEKKFETKSAEYQLIISDMSVQTEAMNKSFKAQLKSEKERHMNEVQKLESKLEETEEKLWLLKNSSSPAPAAKNNGNGKSEIGENPSLSLAAHHTRKTSHSGGAFVEDHRIDVANMIRGEGEGSEWVEPHPRRSPSQHLYNPPTLEQLINNPFPSQSLHQRLSMDDSTSVVSAATEFSSKEITRLENRLSTSENRIHQLTVLLNESEAENARLVQLSNTLKEEIRRTSRNEMREKHLENNEYLKNVVLKASDFVFIMLKTGDEKFRLVPVLKTLLQLSPEEATGVAVIAKGEDPQTTPQGWSDYLHLWSGR
ncbi:GRIP and coiled-coil domain-containing protein 2 [Armadillidium vulgare]|nr:GRIP and coiled-coil domain-containing protein 2 [Armadillidium vulgare]